MAKTIMIVDDSATIRHRVAGTLRQAGYEVLEGCDGQDALERLDALGGQKIHLIVSDLNMPRLDGIGLLKAVRTLPSYRFTPVIMLTTVSEEDKQREGREAGARAWLLKPFDGPALLDAVSQLVLP